MIFLDNASTTKIFDEVNDTIFNINANDYFNPSALYEPSMKVLQKVKEAKKTIAKILNCNEDNIIFTSGATESNNTAIIGSLTSKKDAEYIFSSGEHPSVYAVANSLKSMGKIVKFLTLNSNGTVDSEELKKMLSPNTHFISIMTVSNETGAINDIENLVKIVKDYNSNIIFHTDAVQAFGKIALNVKQSGVDLLTISGHKFHGPKGVGALYVKNPNKLKPLLLGGGQQNGFRSGTENTSGYIGMALAGEIANNNLQTNFKKIFEFRKYVADEVLKNVGNVIINEAKKNSPYILSLSFKNLRGEVLLHLLEQKGILIGIGSACSSKKAENRVLSQMIDKSYVLGSIRISFSSFNTMEEIKTATKILIETVQELKKKIGVM